MKRYGLSVLPLIALLMLLLVACGDDKGSPTKVVKEAPSDTPIETPTAEPEPEEMLAAAEEGGEEEAGEVTPESQEHKVINSLFTNGKSFPLIEIIRNDRHFVKDVYGDNKFILKDTKNAKKELMESLKRSKE